MIETIKLFVEEHLFLALLMSCASFLLALYFRGKAKAIEMAEHLVEHQDDLASASLLEEAAQDASDRGKLKVFNQLLDKVVAGHGREGIMIGHVCWIALQLDSDHPVPEFKQKNRGREVENDHR